MGAKGKSGQWLTRDGLTLLKGWARDGATDEILAKKMGISPSTLYEWKNKFPEISEALKKGKEIVDFEVENAMLKAIENGNVTAMIFWLKNRQPEKWRDKPESTEDAAIKKLDEVLKKLNEQE